MKTLLTTLWLGLVCVLPMNSQAAVIAQALSAVPDLALLETFNPLAGAFSSSADGFQRYQRGVSSSIPASLLDEGGSDTLGIVTGGDNAPFFGVVDTLNADNTLTAVARWVFAVSGFHTLRLALGMAAMGDFESSDSFDWRYRLDGGPLLPLFEGRADESGSQAYPLAGGTFNLADPMVVAGRALDNRFSRFSTALPGSGDRLTVELSAVFNGGTEVAAFRDLQISGTAAAPGAVAAPGTLALLATALAWLIAAVGLRRSAQQPGDRARG